MKSGPTTGPSPVDRGKVGSKHRPLVEAHGIPPAVTLTSGSRNDITPHIARRGAEYGSGLILIRVLSPACPSNVASHDGLRDRDYR
jgi:hypothetical protein